MCNLTARKLKQKGAQIWIERGSRHIISQKEILNQIHNERPIPDWIIRRELIDYELADVIVIPSQHVEDSFVAEHVPKEKLFRNPYGVDLKMFPSTVAPNNRQKIVLFVGTWSLQKGCDILWKACETSCSWKLMHVGPIGDAPVPVSEYFEHIDPVPQWKLIEYFGKADVFALASRQEGLALVQAQALSAGLPLICTDRTGGEDLRNLLPNKKWVTVVPHDSEELLSQAIDVAIEQSTLTFGLRDILGPAKDCLSWSAYGRRYSSEISERQSR